jgi:hypothetical protein
MLVIVDLVRQNDEHCTINEPTVQAFCGAGLEEVWLAANSSVIPLVMYHPQIRLVKADVNYSKIYRWIISSWLTLKVLLANYSVEKKVIFLSATPLHYFLISIFGCLAKIWKHKYFIFMHGELGYLNQPVGLGQKLGSLLIKISFNLNAFSEINFVSIGYPVFIQLQQRYPSLLNRLIYIEIPSPNSSTNTLPHPAESIISLGTFGVQTKDKNSERIYDLAKLLDAMQIDGCQLFTIGLAAQNFYYDQHHKVKHICRGQLGKDYVPRLQFIDAVKTLDWALFFYDHNQKYGLVPSGVFYDCVNYTIPIVAIRSRVLEYYFERYGALGILCDSLDEMATVIFRIKQGAYRREEFIRNLARASEDMSTPNFIKKLMSLTS